MTQNKMSGDDENVFTSTPEPKIEKLFSSLKTITTTATTTAQTAFDAITGTGNSPDAATTSDGDTFAYVIVATIVALIMIAYGIKQRHAKSENVDALIPPGANDAEEDEDEFLTLNYQAAQRSQGKLPSTKL